MARSSTWVLSASLAFTAFAATTCHDHGSDVDSCRVASVSDDLVDDAEDLGDLYLLQTSLLLHSTGKHHPHKLIPSSTSSLHAATDVSRLTGSASGKGSASEAAAVPKLEEVEMDTSADFDFEGEGSGLWQTGLELGQTGSKETSASSDPPSSAAQATGVTANAAGDLPAFVTALFVNIASILCCVGLFMILRGRYPMTFQNNLALNSPPLDTIPEGSWGWMKAAWSVTTEQVADNAGLDQAMHLEFMELGMRIMCWIGIPMFCIIGPVNALLGGHAAGSDRLSYFSFGNVAKGSSLYWMHAFIVWGVVCIVQVAVFKAQTKFLKRRFDWLRDLPNPRANTVLVEGIPQAQQSDARLKEFFAQMFGGPGSVTSTYVVRRAPELEAAWKEREAMKQSCARARFKARKVDAADAEQVDAVQLQDELAEVEKKVGQEQQKVVDKSFVPGSDGYYTATGFVTFSQQSDARLALNMQLSENADEWQISFPPDPNSVLYNDFQQDSTSSQTFMILGYLLTAGLYVLYLPAVTYMTQIAVSINMGTLQPVWQAFAPTVGLQVMVAFLPTFLINIFRCCFTLKDDAWAQQMLQNWYFVFQLVFVILVTAISGSTLDFMKMLVKDPLNVCHLLGQTMPNATHFYMNYLVLQWMSDTLVLLRAAPLSKWIFLRAMYDDETARQMAEPEDQDFYGIGSRSCRMTINLLIGLIYSTLCPAICPIAFVEFFLCRVIYGYLLPFAEMRKPDLGGVFWVQQLRHMFVGCLIYSIMMTVVLLGRADSRGPGMIAGASLAYIIWSMRRFETAFSWQSLPFKELMEPTDCSRKRESSAGEYRQPFMK